MAFLFTIAIVLVIIAYFFPNKKKSTKKNSANQDIGMPKEATTKDTSNSSLVVFSYDSELLKKAKGLYPFKSWRDSFLNYEMDQYTEENCNAAKDIFDQLIEGLLKLGENANEADKVNLFKKAVTALNKLSDHVEDLIETGEREELCELIDQITIASGLNPKKYADGAGIADLWRDW
jgi:hypothetical protein